MYAAPYYLRHISWTDITGTIQRAILEEPHSLRLPERRWCVLCGRKSLPVTKFSHSAEHFCGRCSKTQTRSKTNDEIQRLTCGPTQTHVETNRCATTNHATGDNHVEERCVLASRPSRLDGGPRSVESRSQRRAPRHRKTASPQTKRIAPYEAYRRSESETRKAWRDFKPAWAHE